MSAERYEKPYLDSSVFIAWLKGEISKGVDRKQVAGQILRNAELGGFRICISALTLAEVHKKRGHAQITDDEHTEILRFFEHDYFDVVSVDRMIGEEAHRFCRKYGLSPADAIHRLVAVVEHVVAELVGAGGKAVLDHAQRRADRDDASVSPGQRFQSSTTSAATVAAGPASAVAAFLGGLEGDTQQRVGIASNRSLGMSEPHIIYTP